MDKTGAEMTTQLGNEEDARLQSGKEAAEKKEAADRKEAADKKEASEKKEAQDKKASEEKAAGTLRRLCPFLGSFPRTYYSGCHGKSLSLMTPKCCSSNCKAIALQAPQTQ